VVTHGIISVNESDNIKQYWDIEKLETAIKESGGDIPLRLVVGPNRIGKTWGGVKLVLDTLNNGDNVLWMDALTIQRTKMYNGCNVQNCTSRL